MANIDGVATTVAPVPPEAISTAVWDNISARTSYIQGGSVLAAHRNTISCCYYDYPS